MRKLYVILLAAMLCGCKQYVPGPQGLPGTNGSSCTVTSVPVNNAAPNGGALLSCTDGTEQLILNGVNGTNGTNGINGTNGTNGTVITPIQFCKNPVTTYPSTFAEVGFCINGEIYAVYSANSGFLSPIPDGNYESDGINASCNFTVTGCVISNQSN